MSEPEVNYMLSISSVNEELPIVDYCECPYPVDAVYYDKYSDQVVHSICGGVVNEEEL